MKTQKTWKEKQWPQLVIKRFVWNAFSLANTLSPCNCIIYNTDNEHRKRDLILETNIEDQTTTMGRDRFRKVE
jgi:hypothetical protein